MNERAFPARLSRRLRIIAGTLGAPVTLGGLYLLLHSIALTTASEPPDWRVVGAVFLCGLVTCALGGKLLYLSATGRRRGRVQRWLSALFDATIEAVP